MILSSAGEGLSRRTRRAHVRFSEFIKGRTTSQPQRSHPTVCELPPTSKTLSKKRGKQKATAAELDLADAPTTSAISPPAPRKKRKTTAASASNDVTETVPPVQPTIIPSQRISAQSHDWTARASRRRRGPSTTALPATPDLPPKSRKVILRVLRPEEAVDQLLRRLSEPLPSFPVALDDKVDASISELQARVEAVTTLAEKRSELLRNGRYLPLDHNGERKCEPPDEPQRRVDTWDVILKGIEAAYRPEPLYLPVTRQICEAISPRAEPSTHGQVTQGQLARRAGKAKGSKKQKDDLETAQRKKLAKATVQLVIDQWKRVVLVS